MNGGAVDCRGFQADEVLPDRYPERLLKDRGRIRVKFLDYDWSLNSR